MPLKPILILLERGDCSSGHLRKTGVTLSFILPLKSCEIPMVTSSANPREKNEKVKLLSSTDVLLRTLLQPIPESWGEAPELQVLQGHGGSLQDGFSPDRTPTGPKWEWHFRALCSWRELPPGANEEWQLSLLSDQGLPTCQNQKLLKPCL